MAAFDRQSALKAAEKALRQGRTNIAIAEYVRVVEADPTDWNSANTLGDLYVKARQIDKGVAQYMRIADHLADEGFHAKASALFKKILKIKPDEEYALLQAGEMSARLGLLADARTAFRTVAARRVARGDVEGAAALDIRIAALTSGQGDTRATSQKTLTHKTETPELVTQPEPPDPEPIVAPPTAAQSLDDVFGQLREETEQDPAELEAMEQYRLALTYRELGMLDDAIHALQEAVAAPRVRFEAASLLGGLYLDRGEPHQAIEWLGRAVEAPPRSSDASRAVLYDLAAALESVGEYSRALAICVELQAESQGYRDVSVRIDRLSELQTKG